MHENLRILVNKFINQVEPGIGSRREIRSRRVSFHTYAHIPVLFLFHHLHQLRARVGDALES